MRSSILLILSLIVVSCSGNKKSKEEASEKATNDVETYKANFRANTEIQTYDQYASKANTGYGAQIGERIVAIPFTLAAEAGSVRIIYRGSDIEPMARGYLWYDITQNLLFLRVSGPPKEYPELLKTQIPKDLYGLTIYNNRLQKYSVKRDSAVFIKSLQMYTLNNKFAEPGNALFTSDHKLAGVVTTVEKDGKSQKVLYPAYRIKAITDTLKENIKSISNLRFKTDKVYPSPKEIDRFRINTTMGNFDIRFSSKLPEYEKNFIRLASDGYYDSLLVHRVIRNFLIQMGAADTKYAKKDDPLGWKGPGYTLPTKIIPGLYHKRGAVAASKPPKYNNTNNRTDGSQFYVISGRKFTDAELDEIEDGKGFRFTPEERRTYKTVGGAPYLDKEFAVIGEVVRGMDVVDSIAAVAINPKERPLKDIRIRSIQLIKK